MKRTNAHASSEWSVDSHTEDIWPSLVPGTRVTIVKRSHKHHGEERARYSAVVVPSTIEEPWVETETHWTAGTVVQAQVTFENDDVLREIFSPVHPFNAFAVYRPSGELKGWYANVTYPTLVETNEDPPVVVWRDLYLDVVATPDGEVHVLDEDELEEAGLVDTDPALHERILAARDELVSRFRDRRAPFHASELAGSRS